MTGLVIWDSYSIDIGKYNNSTEEDEFKATMSRIISTFDGKHDQLPNIAAAGDGGKACRP